jgi:hypothetical protein
MRLFVGGAVGLFAASQVYIRCKSRSRGSFGSIAPLTGGLKALAAAARAAVARAATARAATAPASSGRRQSLSWA